MNFLETKGPKEFEARFIAIEPADLLSEVARALAGIQTPQGKEWNLDKKILKNVNGIEYFTGRAQFPIANFHMVVAVTCYAYLVEQPGLSVEQPRELFRSQHRLPLEGRMRQGAAIETPREHPPLRRPKRSFSPEYRESSDPCRLVIHFEGGGWEAGSENYVDYAMGQISKVLDQTGRQMSSWYMTKGSWQVRPAFAAKKPRGNLV